MDELKACPFCGSSNTTLDYYEISGPQELGTIVVCNDCGASAKSIVDWNTRPIEDALNARIAELEAEKERLRLERLADDSGSYDSLIPDKEFESLEHSLECHKRGIQNRDKTIANLHKVIKKQQLKIQRQAETITILLHLYTSGKRCKAHKRLREKYRLLKASFTEWKAMG